MSVTGAAQELRGPKEALTHIRMDGSQGGLPRDPRRGRMVQAGGTAHAETWQAENAQREGARSQCREP